MRCISLAAESDDMLYSVDNQLHRAILQCNTFAQQYQHLGPFLFNIQCAFVVCAWVLTCRNIHKQNFSFCLLHVCVRFV